MGGRGQGAEKATSQEGGREGRLGQELPLPARALAGTRGNSPPRTLGSLLLVLASCRREPGALTAWQTPCPAAAHPRRRPLSPQGHVGLLSVPGGHREAGD